jgi:hypothetical protein
MLSLVDRGRVQTCSGVTRRDFLQAGALGAIGLALPDYLAAREQAAVNPEHDKRSAILIFNLGAPSQLDTFDIKPKAPREVRGLDSGKNFPHGLYVDNIGLNGVVVMPNTTERTVFITADDWVTEQSSTLYFVTGEGGGHATWPVILHIRQATEPASGESTSTGSEAPAG